MIDKLTYEEIDNIVNILSNSNVNIKNIINEYKQKSETGTIKMERFSIELDNYINYLKSIIKINKDADNALEKLKELNN